MELPRRLWFKLERIKTALRAALGSREQTYDTSLRMCSNCRGLIERNASACPLCGAPTKPARARAGATPGRVLGGLLPVPSTATSVLVAANVALYGIEWYLAQAAASGASSGMGGMGEITGQIMIRLGAKSPDILNGQWWRLVTAMFLHAGLLHIGMNIWCLVDLGPTVESLFSTPKFIVLYLATGVCGFFLSFWWSPLGVSLGASGAILGLVGILIGASFHHGRLGKDLRSQLWRWVIYIFIFGLLPWFAVDNAAHLGGLASGFVLGYLVPEGEPLTRSSENLWNTLAVVSVVLIAGSFALMALQLNRPAG